MSTSKRWWTFVLGPNRYSRFFAAGSLACGLAMSSQVHAQLIYQENFEGNASGYTLEDPGYEPQAPENGWSPGIWGLNTLGPQIGLASNAPANRAAVLWNHDPVVLGDDFTSEALDVWVSLADWSMGVTTPANRASKKISFFPGYSAYEAVDVVRNKLVQAGYTGANISEAGADPLAIDPSQTDLVIYSSEQAGAVFVSLPVPLITFSAPDHDDNAIVGLGATLNFNDSVTLSVPQAYQNHPALGGKAIAQVEDPNTGELAPAIFVIDKGSPLLGAFNPDPEGDRYIVGSALNKFGSTLERKLELKPVNVAGKTDVKVRVALAGVTSDFESGDYLIFEVDPDGSGPKGVEVVEEFWGVDDATSACNKGLSNGDVAGQAGDICLTPDFADYTFPIPAGATDMVLSVRGLTTWGNEIFALDNIRIFSGNLLPGDFNGNGSLDAGDLDLLANGQATNDKAYDLDGSNSTDFTDRLIWVRDLKNSWIGDSDLNGQFNTADFVSVFQAGKFETGQSATWTEGDWNGDKLFSTADFVAAFQDGGFEQGPRAAVSAVPEPAASAALLMGCSVLALRRKKPQQA